jgi:hypothetical protein
MITNTNGYEVVDTVQIFSAQTMENFARPETGIAYCTENPIQVFPEIELCGPFPIPLFMYL